MNELELISTTDHLGLRTRFSIPTAPQPLVMSRERTIALAEALYGCEVRVVSRSHHASEPYVGTFVTITVEGEDGTYPSGISMFGVRLYARELQIETHGWGSTTHVPVGNVVEFTVLGPPRERCWWCYKWDDPDKLKHEDRWDDTAGEDVPDPNGPLVHAACEHELL